LFSSNLLDEEKENILGYKFANITYSVLGYKIGF